MIRDLKFDVFIFALLIGLMGEANAIQPSGVWEMLPTLTKEDIALARKTAQQDMGGKAPGTILAWSNPKSGNSGTVTLIRNLKWETHDCQKVSHVFMIKNDEPQQWEFTSCLMKDGSWKWPVPPKRLR